MAKALELAAKNGQPRRRRRAHSTQIAARYALRGRARLRTWTRCVAASARRRRACWWWTTTRSAGCCWRAALEQQGHAVDLPRTAGWRWTCCAREPFDLVLLDVMMPELDGEQVLEHARRRPATCATSR